MINNRSIINFEEILNVNNPNSMHGIYPYRGKISALEATKIISQLPKDGTILDPFCGSGTIIYEAQKHGLNAIGIDNNPLAVDLSKAKTYRTDDIKEIIGKCKDIISRAKLTHERKKYKLMPESPAGSFHMDTANEIMSVYAYYDEMDDFLKGVFYGAIALAARGCNDYMWTSSTVGKNIEPKRYINFYDKLLDKTKKHSKFCNTNECKAAQVILSDSRNISKHIKDRSIDYVFTSPPYFDALDYTAYYGKLIYEIMEVDRIEIKKSLIQSADSYENDMRLVMKELDRVTKDDALIIFVVGDKKAKNGVINGGEFFNNIKGASYIVERTYSGSSSQVFDTLNNTSRKEQIVVWNKCKGEVLQYGI